MKHLYQEVFRLFTGWLSGRRKAGSPVIVTNTETIRRSRPEKPASRPGGNDLLVRVEAFLCREYAFRFNCLTEATEFRLRSQPGEFISLGKRELNDLCISCKVTDFQFISEMVMGEFFMKIAFIFLCAVITAIYQHLFLVWEDG